MCSLSFNHGDSQQSSMWVLNKQRTNKVEAVIVCLAVEKENPKDVSQVRGEGMKTRKLMIMEEENYISVSN